MHCLVAWGFGDGLLFSPRVPDKRPDFRAAGDNDMFRLWSGALRKHLDISLPSRTSLFHGSRPYLDVACATNISRCLAEAGFFWTMI